MPTDSSRVGSAAQPEVRAFEGRSQFISGLVRFLHVRMAAVGLSIVLLCVFMAVFAPIISPYDPNYQDYSAMMKSPSLAHPFGTDRLGRDDLSRIMYGTQTSLMVGVVAVGVSLALGVPLGLVSGYFRGWVDDVIMRAMDALYAFPSLILALAIVAVVGPSIFNVMVAIGITTVPLFARLVRGQVLSLREQEFVHAAECLGASRLRIMALHIWPNATAPVIVQSSIGLGFAVLAEASMSFLGVGVQPPTPTWGGMLQLGSPFLVIAPWLAIFPGLAIFALVLGFNFVGDALRDVLDPRLRGKLDTQTGR